MDRSADESRPNRCSAQVAAPFSAPGMGSAPDRAGGGMIPAFASTAPGLAPLCRALTVGGDDEGLAPLDAEGIARALAAFAGGFPRPERRALASLWSMHYLHAVVVPAAAAALTLDRVLPLALDGCRLRLAADGTPTEVRLGGGVPPGGSALGALVHGHLVPFVALHAAVSGVAPRLLWSNAAVTLAFMLDRVAGAALPGPRREAQALLDGGSAFPHLAGAFRETMMGERERLLCCGRRRLSGVAPCHTLCPERDVW